MIKKILEALSQPLGRIGLGIAALAVLSAAVWGIAETQKAPEQPIQVPHRLHVGLGLQCMFCHPGALRGPSPGIPTQTKCWGCHQQITVRGTELPKLASYVENNRPIPWVPVAQMPDNRPAEHLRRSTPGHHRPEHCRHRSCDEASSGQYVICEK